VTIKGSKSKVIPFFFANSLNRLKLSADCFNASSLGLLKYPKPAQTITRGASSMLAISIVFLK